MRRGNSDSRLHHLHTSRLCDLSKLLLFTFPLLLFALADFLFRVAVGALSDLHILEADLVAVCIRVGMLVVLRDIFKLLLAHFAVERTKHGGDL